MKTFLNYLGQLRLYSLADLALLLLAARADTPRFWGAITLWLGFLALLEFSHKHDYRTRIPAAAWVVLFGIGWALYGGLVPSAYILCSLAYTQKNKRSWGLLSPLMRGIQTTLVIGGITGFAHTLPYVAGLLIAARNLLGDVRDAGKDARDGMRTLPVAMGIKRNSADVHLVGMLATSAVWWVLGGLPIVYLVITFIVIVLSYRLTPR